MNLAISAIKAVFSLEKYRLTRETQKVDEYLAPHYGQFVYFLKDRDTKSSISVVIHPSLELEPFLAIDGVSCKDPDHFHHHSNMRQFPKRRNRGQSETPYGRLLVISSRESLGHFLSFLDTPAGSQLVGSDLPPRLTAIELENFKGVGNRIRIEFAPITLLFGANSAGKSTILQALQYAREVLERGNTNPDRTLMGGEFVDLGGFRNLVHQHDEGKTIAIKLELKLNRASLPEFVPEAFDDWQEVEPEVSDLYELLHDVRNRAESVSVELQIGWSSVRQEVIVKGYEVGLNGQLLAKIVSQADGKDAAIQINPKNPIFIRYLSQNEIDNAEELLSALDENHAPDSSVQTDVAPDVDDLDHGAYSIWPQIKDTLADEGIERPGQGFRQWLSNADGALPKLGYQMRYVPSGDAKGATAVYLARLLTAFLSCVIVGPGMLICNRLRELRYLGPIRNVPHRDFVAALTPDESRWADGTAAWEALLNFDESLLEEVSHWMSDQEKLATGYTIKRTDYKEVRVALLNFLMAWADPDSGVRQLDPELLKMELRESPEKHRIDIVESEPPYLVVQPRDVGIGISQVLPVVVAALEPSAALVAIEQPELHIHPAMQVGLGDLFIKGAKEYGINFLVETHSEHLILRLLRRIRETTDNEIPPGYLGITPSDLAVIYVQSNEAGVELVPLPVDETGEFTTRWPKGFFDERAEELF